MTLKSISLSFLSHTALSFTTLTLAACSGASDQASAKDGSSAASTIADNPKLVANRAREGALGDMVLGNEESGVTLVEYASLTCGHCASFHAAVYPSIKEKYIETGKIKFVFRELPTPPQDRSLYASALARCTADKGGDNAYFVMVDALFKTQGEWAFGNDPIGSLQKIAAQAGMNNDAIKACWSRQEILDTITENVKEANNRFQITGTPSFVLNGEKLALKSLADLETKLAEATGTPLVSNESPASDTGTSEHDHEDGETHDESDHGESDHDAGEEH